MIQETAAEELDLKDRTTVSRTSAQKKHKSSLVECEEQFVASRQKSQQMKDASIAKIEERRELEPEILKEKHEQRIIELNSTFFVFENVPGLLRTTKKGAPFDTSF